ncbi:hypothetical protein mRhiFer1_007886 [Rhinolophus ferrumequinum]|uniref:Uncharacterized protein n=1 Tax=Rhinolophus ferrumequinum TaxID=59479 RepID=A0A7J8AV76_RHIFE|nr:hypothetical protein mRhiFer1_007886 [Rhinolophus ferrumequinum]
MSWATSCPPSSAPMPCTTSWKALRAAALTATAPHSSDIVPPLMVPGSWPNPLPAPFWSPEIRLCFSVADMVGKMHQSVPQLEKRSGRLTKVAKMAAAEVPAANRRLLAVKPAGRRWGEAEKVASEGTTVCNQTCGGPKTGRTGEAV